MHKYTQELIQKINNLTENKPIIYFARDPERALGLENHLKNFYIVCIEKSYITEQLYKTYPEKIFCTETESITIEHNSTLDLVNNSTVIEWVKKITNNAPFYAQLFQFNQPVYLELQKLGATILNNDANLNRLFEDKLSQLKILVENEVQIPKGEIIEVNNQEYADLSNKFAVHSSQGVSKFVIQLDRAHTGLGTFVIENKEDFEQFKLNYIGNIVKISEFIEGEPYTINGVVTKTKTYVNGLQYQITGLKELTSGKGSTVGNDWSFANSLNQTVKDKIFSQMQKIGEVMRAKGYKGLFGIDLIVRGDDIFLIEINARQTANTSLQTKLEINQNLVPLMLIHLSEFMNIELPADLDNKITNIEGSQIFLRSKADNFKLYHVLPSGIFRLQSDNSAKKWSFDKIKMTFQGLKEKLIFIDEEKDKPLIWQRDGYSIDQIGEGGFVILLQNKDAIRNKFEEVARMQFRNQIVYNNKVSAWVLEALINIENQFK